MQIISYVDNYKNDFARLNLEWLEKYFVVEDIDKKVLFDPQGYILSKGGQIFFAIIDEKVAGTVALIAREKKRLELSKMAVSPDFQGQNIGRKLLNHAIEWFHLSPFETLFLESNSKLKPALNLYESSGFFHVAKPDGNSDYKRADVYMEYQPN